MGCFPNLDGGGYALKVSRTETAAALLRTWTIAVVAGATAMAIALILTQPPAPPAAAVLAEATPSEQATPSIAAATEPSLPTVTPEPVRPSPTVGPLPPTARAIATNIALGGATPRPAVSPTTNASQPLQALGAPSVVPPGGSAQVTIRTAPRANCEIAVEFPTGRSRAAGLVPKTAGEDGLISWSWVVGSTTEPGNYQIVVQCSDGGRINTLTLPLQIR